MRPWRGPIENLRPSRKIPRPGPGTKLRVPVAASMAESRAGTRLALSSQRAAMTTLVSLALYAALFYVMMRYGCGSHRDHGHGRHDTKGQAR